MDHFQTYLASLAHTQGRAVRSASVRHRRLSSEPIVLLPWQLGAEPFGLAALAWGSRSDEYSFFVAGDPRNRQLAFDALLPFASWFNVQFERPWATRQPSSRGRRQIEVALTSPQIIVANAAALELLGRLGRRLAYLPADGDPRPDPALIRLGRHLQFVGRDAQIPGQQLAVVLTELLAAHWATPLSGLESASLGALDGYIEPPSGLHGFEAAAAAEMESIGPVPSGEDDSMLEPLVGAFNAARAGRVDRSTVEPLLRPIVGHYGPRIDRGWVLVWKCLSRELAFAEADSCSRRFREDCHRYSEHMEWLGRGGLRRTRETPRQAAMRKRELEQAQQILDAEEATDDPLRIITHQLSGKAVTGCVVDVDLDYFETPGLRKVQRPLVTIECDGQVSLARGRELYWASDAAGPAWEIFDVQNSSTVDRARVVLKHLTSRKRRRPSLGENVCFSVFHTRKPYQLALSREAPWTHVPAAPGPGPTSLEADEVA
jgi:hypothetical protein